MKHSDKPEMATEISNDLKDKIDAIKISDYSKYVKTLIPLVKKRMVSKTIPGRTGFILFLNDENWVITYLESRKLHWQHGFGKISNDQMKLIENPQFNDGFEKIEENLPYSDEICDITEEILKCTGKEILGLSIGEDSFNFCFPDNMELDAMIFPAGDDKLCLRVFWEQW